MGSEEMKYVIDRIEGNIAICEDENGKMVELDIAKLPLDIKEGSIIIEKNSRYIIDEKVTEEKKKEVKKRMNNLWK